MKKYGILSFLMFGMLMACAPSQPQSNSALTTIMAVRSVTVCGGGEICLSQGRVPRGEVWIIADGLVNSGGWSAPELVPVLNVQLPPDGIYNFAFRAVPPRDFATQALERITVRHVLRPPPSGFRGARVTAQEGAMVGLLPGS